MSVINYYQEIITSISNIENDKSAIANAISEKGVTVPQDASLGDYPALIANIPTGGGDSPARYGIRAQMQSFSDENQGLFITDYVPTGTTTVCVNLVIDKGEEASTNVFFGCDSSDANDNIFKIWRDDIYLYFDRKNDGSERISWEIDDTWYNFDFGNNFIRHYGEVKAEDSSYNVSWTASGPLAFGGIVDCSSGNASEYSKSGALFEWIEIFELTGNSEEYDHEEYGKKMRRYVTAYDASDNYCLYDEITQSFLYPTGTIAEQPERREDPYIYAPDSSTEPSPTPTPTPDPSTDSSVTLYDVMAVNGGYEGLFNTGYVPTKDTVVKFQGSMVGQGDISHGIFTSDAEEQGSFRIFGLGDSIFYDRDGQGNIRVISELSSLENHEYEFGNFYIKIDNTDVVAEDSSLDSNWSLPSSIPLCIFGALDENGGEHYAGSGELITWFEIWEPEDGTLTLQKRYVPAKDASDNACLYESVNEDVIYPTAGSDFNVYNNI